MITRLDNPLQNTVDLSDESLSGLDTTPPLSAEQLPRQESVSVLIFTHDAELANTIRSLSGTQLHARVVNEWRDLLALVEQDHGRIVLLDVDALKLSVDKALIELTSHADWLVVIIAAKQHQAQDFMRFWSERRIHRLLIKPAAVGITRLLLESAINRYVELKTLDQVGGSDSGEAAASTRPPSKFRAPQLTRYVLAGLGLAGMGLAVIAYFSDRTSGLPDDITVDVAAPAQREIGLQDPIATLEPSDIAQPESAAQAAAGLAAPPAELAEQLAAAAAAAAAGRLTDPGGQGALDYYLDVLERSPGHLTATTELAKVVEQLFSQAEAMLLDGELEAAEAVLGSIARAVPAGSRLRFLQEQLGLAQQAGARSGVAATDFVESPERATPEPAEVLVEPDVARLIAAAENRLSQGFLLEPTGDSARDYLDQAAALVPNDPGLLDLRVELGQALTRSARVLIAADALAQADELIAAAANFSAPSDVLTALDADLDAAYASRQRAELDALSVRAEQRIDEAWLTDPEQDSAFDLITQLRERAPEHPRLADLDAMFVDRAQSSVRDSMARQDWSAADSLLMALQGMTTDRQGNERLMAEFEFARRQAEYLSMAAPVSELVQTAGAAPVYPRIALENGITGWVDIEFVVGVDGVPRDVVVTGAEPSGRFENSSIEAVETYRFEPFELDSAIYQRLIRIRIRYQLD